MGMFYGFVVLPAPDFIHLLPVFDLPMQLPDEVDALGPQPNREGRPAFPIENPSELLPILEGWLSAFGCVLEERHIFWLFSTIKRCVHGRFVMPQGFPIALECQCKDPLCTTGQRMVSHLKDLGLGHVRPEHEAPPLGGMADCWKTFLWLKPDDVTGPLPLTKALSMFEEFLCNTAVPCSSENCKIYRREERKMRIRNNNLRANALFMQRFGRVAVDDRLKASVSNPEAFFPNTAPGPYFTRTSNPTIMLPAEEVNVLESPGMKDCTEHIPPLFVAERKMLLSKVPGGYHLEVCPRRKAFLGKDAWEIYDELKLLVEDWKRSVPKPDRVSVPIRTLLPLSDSGCVVDWPEDTDEWLLGLTTAVVMGTIGDVEPTLDVVASNYFTSQIEKVEDLSFRDHFIAKDCSPGVGWMASDFFDVCPEFSRVLSDKYENSKCNLVVSKHLWNNICSVWGGDPMPLELEEDPIPGQFPSEQSISPNDCEVVYVVPPRPVGVHKRPMPPDFVLVTHPDHLERFSSEGWQTNPLPIDSRSFIDMGQRILQGGLMAVKDMKAMHETLFQCLRAAQLTVEQSDLVYLVSGTTFHYFVGSLFPDKQIFEVCPVPREDNGVCPEFYLGHYFRYLSLDPSFGFKIGRMYAKLLTAPKYLKELEWEGTYKYSEPPKFHSIMPWAAQKWNISGPNVGFKPFDDFVAKVCFEEKEKLKIYFSLGSCEKINTHAESVIKWLQSLNADLYVDSRWMKKFVGPNIREAPFFSHALGLHQYDLVVHHGGSGVTNTCLIVGVPQMIIPIIGDQFIWYQALKKQLVPPFTDEYTLRAWLFDERLPPRYLDEPFDNLPLEWQKLVNEVGGRWVEPFAWHPQCCHDLETYGYPEILDRVVADLDTVWITTFDTGSNRGKGPHLNLKWISKTHMINGPKLPGRRGFPTFATYPNHAHGWLGYFEKISIGCVDTQYAGQIDYNLWADLAKLNIASKEISNKYQRVLPSGGTCEVCGKERDLLLLRVCLFCCSRRLENGYRFEELLNSNPAEIYQREPRLKPYPKSLPHALGIFGTAVQSRKRYYQLDSRMLARAPNYRVARALLDQVRDLDDVMNVEAFWKYTNCQPPHYTFKTSESTISYMIQLQVRKHASVTTDRIMEDLVRAMANVLSIGSLSSISKRVLNRNILNKSGRDFMAKKWHVLVDALRHFDDLAKSLDINAMPAWVRERFDPLPHAKHKSLIAWGLASPRQIRSRAGSKMWMNLIGGTPSQISIHLFSLKLPALGTRFGVFHAVVEYQGWFWELQQVAGETCRINRTAWAPEGTPDRPLVKTIIVDEPVIGSLSHTQIKNQFDGLDYKVLGDNCLVFANLLVYLLTGKVVPWRHFGVFGKDLEFDLWPNFKQYVSSFFFLEEDEERLAIREKPSDFLNYMKNGEVAKQVAWVGPKRFVRDYGLVAVQRVDAVINAFHPDGIENLPMERDHLLDFIELGTKNFGLSGFVLARAIMTRRLRRIPTSRSKFRFLERVLVLFRQLKDIKIVADLRDVIDAVPTLQHVLRRGRKVAWTPLFNITVPRHWFRSGSRLVEMKHDPENLQVQPKKRVVLDLPQIVGRYKHYFPNVEFPKIGFKYVKPGEYEVGVKVPIRKKLPEMDNLTLALVRELQDMHPFEMGVFSLRFGTEAMAERVTDRYFSGSFEEFQLISEAEQEEIAEAIFTNEKRLFENAQLINPEEVWRKWHRNYSAGFPYRFNARGNDSRQHFVDAAGGKEAFLQGIRRYIESPEAFPTVSHAFIKDEVLPRSYVEREKIRTIIAQDPLNYFLSMAVQGDHNKRLDPTSFSAVGVSAAHGEMAELAEKHLAYRHHYAMDVTAMDSTMAVDCFGVIKKLRKKGFINHPQREAVETIIDATYDNLMTSWIIDIHTGRARLKKQGATTGHASTTPINTEYMRVLMLKAWHEITGRPYAEFYDTVMFSTYSDDNYWSTDLDPQVFSAELVSEYWLRRGVQVRVEGSSDNLGDISFLSKRLSLSDDHLQEVKDLTGMAPRVAIVHDRERLLQKFSDYKKRNTLRYRWEKYTALQMNCAHHRDVFDKVGEYLDVLEKELLKRPHNRKFIQQHPRKTYVEVLNLMYQPTDKTKQGLIVHSVEETTLQKLEGWWDTLRANIMTFDSDANTYARVLQQFTGLLEIGGLNVEDPSLFLKGPGELRHDDEFTLEHHLYLLNGCPESFEKMQMLASKSPFSAFMDIEGFWPRREVYSLSEETANGLRVKVLMLMGIYTLVAWLEQALFAVPVVGPIYRVFCTAKYMSEKAYSRLNSLYYAMFGDSSLVISSLMPKDRYFSIKVVAHNIWCSTTALDIWDHPGDVGALQNFVDTILKFGQDIHNLAFEGDISVVLPIPGTGERDKSADKRAWVGLDHHDSVLACKDHLVEGAIPLITAETAAGKSTDFISSLSQEYDTVIVACPRTILVEQNPVAATRLYAGCSDKLTPGVINFGTAGYLRRILGDLPNNSILVLDEFHELYEDGLWLLERYPGQCITISATPKFFGSDRLTNVHLTKSRALGHKITEEYRDGAGSREEAWEALRQFGETQDKVLVVLPSVRMVKTFEEHATRLFSNKRVCTLFRNNTEVKDADWYFATSVVDAGLTIPNLTVVIDTGWSLGFVEGEFVKRPSSHNVSEQRRGRTGRTNDGTYIRLKTEFCDDPFDFSTPFLCNNWEVASLWHPHFRRGLCHEKGVIESLPGGYNTLLESGNWSGLIYLVFLYERRGDVNAAREMYQHCRKFPFTKEFKHLMGPIENQPLHDLHHVEASLSRFRLPGQDGNFWSHDLHSVELINFAIPVPRHLRDVD
uniref:Polyprotein n=1 Tax=Trichoderma harzianum hypovirus 1 TaxID=2664558 RepID=A0A5Q0QPJ5_9VIRU|nr:polyprotein [Trichoderma harzianum hypovirus 1]